MAHQFIFTMKDLRKVVPPKREILKGIWLSFYPGRQDRRPRRATAPARPRCCASWPAWTRTSSARRWPADGVAGRLPARRSRSSTPRKDVRGNVEEGVAEMRGAARRASTRSARKLGEPLGRRRDGEAARRAGAACRTRSRPPTPGTSTARSRSPWTRCALPAGRRRRDDALRRRARGAWRSAGCCSRSRTCCCSTSPPTTSTPSRWPGSSSFLQGVPGHGRRRHPRPLLPRQRGGLDPRARPRRGHPLGGQLLLLARAEAAAAGAGGEAGAGAAAHARARARVGAHVAARAPGQEQGAPARPTRSCSPRTRQRARRRRPRSSSRRARAWATWWCEAEDLAQGLRRPAAHRRPHLQPARAAASSASSAPTARARRRCSA